MSFFKVESWTCGRLVESLGTKPNSKGEKIEIPKFQRSIVWSNAQKQVFIESLKSGFPIGAILLFEARSEDRVRVFHLIDGLQRSTTLKAHAESPLHFISESDLFDFAGKEDLFKIFKVKESEIISWLHDRKSFTETDGFSGYYFAEKMLKGLRPTNDQIQSAASFLEHIKRRTDLSNFEIPAIIYTGNSNNLPIIFERLNKQGTKLNKYQIYAASWINNTVDITNESVISKIKQRYEELIEQGLEIDGYQSDSSDFSAQSFSVFEYVFGLGKYWASSFPNLIRTTDDDADAYVFNLVTTALGLDLQDMGKLPDCLAKIKLPEFEASVEECMADIEKTLRPYIAMKVNRKSGSAVKQIIHHSESQIVSIISNYYLLKDLIEDKRKFLRNIPMYYLFDIVRSYWSSSVDSKIMDSIRNGRYLSPVDNESISSALIEWHKEQTDKRESVRTNIGSDIILVLKYIYSHILTVHEETSMTEFEIDHVIPVDMLKSLAAKKEEGLPISAISNLCLLPKDLNRQKGPKTYCQFVDEELRDKKITQPQADELIRRYERYALIDRSEIERVTDNLTRENYKSFLDQRFAKIKEMLIKNLIKRVED